MTINPHISHLGKQQTIWIVSASLLMMAAAVLTLLIPYLLNGLLEEWKASQALFSAAVLVSGTLALALILHTLGSFLSVLSAERLKANLRQSALNKLLKKPLAYHKQHGHGETLSLLYSDMEQVAGFYAALLPSTFSGLLLWLGAAVMLIKINATLALVLLVTAGFIFLFGHFLTRFFSRLGHRLQEQLGQTYGRVGETLRQILLIKTYRLRGWTLSRFKSDQKTLVGLSTRLQTYRNISSLMVQVLMVIVLLAAWILLSQGHSQVTEQQQLPALLYGLLLVRQTGTVIQLVTQYKQLAGVLQRVNPVFEGQEDTGSNQNLPNLETLDIQKVSLQYDNQPIFSQVSLEINQGDKVLLTGPNGAGKTSLFHILLGLVNPSDGEILWNRSNIQNYHQDQRFARIAYLPQNSLLYQASLRDNLLLGNLGASPEQLSEVLDLAGLKSLVGHLNQGLDTEIGVGGDLLSGGEQRRLAIARTLLVQNADLYLLDEPTEGLDPEAEEEILSKVMQVLKDKTVIMISHRRPDYQFASVKLILKNGNLHHY